jgi:hypothetical protein
MQPISFAEYVFNTLKAHPDFGEIVDRLSLPTQKSIDKADRISTIGNVSGKIIGIGFNSIVGSRIFLRSNLVPIADIFDFRLRFYVPSKPPGYGVLWVQDETRGFMNKEIVGLKFSTSGKYDRLRDAIQNEPELMTKLRQLLLSPLGPEEIADLRSGSKVNEKFIKEATMRGNIWYIREAARVKIEISADPSGKTTRIEAIPANRNSQALKDLFSCVIGIAPHIQTIFPQSS